MLSWIMYAALWLLLPRVMAFLHLFGLGLLILLVVTQT